MPSAYCRYAQSLWNHETEDLRRLHSQQKNIANFQLRHHEFQTMDDLLIRSRDFINSQHFYEVVETENLERRAAWTSWRCTSGAWRARRATSTRTGRCTTSRSSPAR